MEISEFEKQINYEFENKRLLKTALTHTSYAHEKKIQSNEKLEFLGDSILEFIISEYIYDIYKDLTEGEMTKVRAQVVCEASLYKLALKLNFSDFLYLGKSEISNNGSKRPAILADSVEAVIAAIYLDSGIENTKKFIINNLKQAVKQASRNVGMKDYKTVLQEKLQVNGNVKIIYKIIKETGPDHNKTFKAQVLCNKAILAHGVGKTKKSAEMQAAKAALERLNN